ncbi:MAG: hypothetical protein H6722_16455 [Sandaracinus sp.]|nr:hypothetical protein [Sandaracinus sp.]MCB9614033.1 hypothetical protein [Sandaracinus sp.]MCB9620644.1 hypothetical protein [Sandaracinus sp.]
MKLVEAFTAVANDGGWLGGVALAAWALACLVPVVALGTKRRSVVWVATATVGLGWLASMAPVSALCSRMMHFDAAPWGWRELGLSLAYLHAGGASLTLGTTFTALAFARVTSPLAALPWAALVIAAVGATLYPRAFFEAYGWFGSRPSLSSVVDRGLPVLSGAKEAVLVLGVATAAVAWTRASAWTPRAGEAIAWLVVGVAAFVLTRGHAHDAAHPLPSHETAIDDVETPFPEGRTCRRPARSFDGMIHTARFGGGLELDGVPVDDLDARLGELRREWSVRHPAEPIQMPLQLLDRPRPEDLPVLRALAAAGFEPPELETVRRFQVHTATRGVVDLAERCGLPWPPDEGGSASRGSR